MSQLSVKKNIIVVFWVLYAVVLFFNNGRVSLWDQDEAAYAAFGKQMIETKDFVIPHYTWSKIHRKPPLHFWLIAVSYKLFGINEFAVRFWTSLAVLGSVLLMFFLGKKLWDTQLAFLSSVILGTNFFVPLIAKIALTDALLLFVYTLTGFSFFLFLKLKNKKWLFWFWFAIALGLLVKGPPIIIFAGLLFLTSLLFCEDKKQIIKIHPWIYGLLALIPLFLWGYTAWQKDNGKFIRWLIDWYILKRVNSSVLGQTGPPGYYLFTFLIFFISFLPFLPQSFISAFRSLKTKKKPIIYFSLWLISGWLIYEFLKSKLPSYVLAAYPAISLLIAFEIKTFLFERKNFYGSKILLFLKFFVLIAALTLYFIFRIEYNLPVIIALFLVIWILIVGIEIYLFFRHKKSEFIKWSLIGAFVIYIFAFALVFPKIDKLKNAPKKTAEYIAKIKNNNTVCVIENNFGTPPSLPFYIETIAKIPYKQTYNCDSILNQYNSKKHYVFVLDQKCFDFLNKHTEIKQFKKISSLVPDRKGTRNYIIVKNFE